MIRDRNVQAFLMVVRSCEGTADADGYRRMFGGELFDSYADHPRKRIPYKDTHTTAAGAYQFLASTWDDCRAHLSLPDFSPASQDEAAVFLIQRRSALQDVIAGRLDDAIGKCNREWASLPGAPYGQPTRSLGYCRQVYEANGGRYVANSATTVADLSTAPDTPIPDRKLANLDRTKHMGATLLATLLPSVLGLFSDRAQAAISRATGASPEAAAKFAQDISAQVQSLSGVQVTDQASAIKAVATIASDTDKIKALEAHASDFVLAEVGGGIGGARKANADYIAGLEDDEWWRPAVKLLFTPVNLVSAAGLYMAYLFIHPLVARVPDLSPEAVIAFIMAFVGIPAIVFAYWLGTVQQRKE